MDARLFHVVLCAASLLSLGAGYRTQNFLVTASTPQLAQEVATAAENYRRDLAVEWLGQEIPPWREPCPITVHAGPQLGAGGATSFMFLDGHPSGWTMTIQGSPERILDSVLPHEVTHTIFASHFGRPLPRWADEGACTTVEHASEREKQHRLLFEFLTTGRGIPFNQMFAMKEYPPDILPLYSQGYSLARFLIAQGGKKKFINYVGDGMSSNNWTKATQTHYTFKSLSDLQVMWLEWVRRGCPPVASRDTQIASNEDSSPGVELANASATNDNATTKPAATPGRATLASHVRSLDDGQSPGGNGTSWYARVRDDASAERTRGEPNKNIRTASNPSRAGFSQSGRASAPKNSPQVVTRPQPPERAQQHVIQWTQP